MQLQNTESSLNPNSNSLEPDRPQHDRPAACVIAQQYSSATSSHYTLTVKRKNPTFVSKMFAFSKLRKVSNCVAGNCAKSGSVCKAAVQFGIIRFQDSSK